MPPLPPDAEPLTAAQTAMWFGQQQVPGSAVYQCAERIDIHGEFDARRFDAVLTDCLSRIDPLNARYRADIDGPYRVDDPRRRHELRQIDVSGDADPSAAAQAAITRFMAAGFTAAGTTAAGTTEIADTALSDQCLITVSATHHIWVQRIHHVSIDGYSFAALLRWVAACHTAALTGEPAPTDPFTPAASAPDAAPAAGDQQFWIDYCRTDSDPPTLSGAPAAAAVDHPHRFTRKLSPRTMTGHGWAESVTAAVAMYLAVLTGERDVIVGMPWANRRMGAAPTIEPTVNIAPLRMRVAPTATIDDFVGSAAAEIRSLRPHSRYRADQLRRDIGAIDTGHALYGPVVNIKFFTPELHFGAATGTITNISMGPVDDMTFTASPQPDGALTLEVEANPHRYSAEATQAHADRLAALLDDLTAEHPATPLGALTVAGRTDVTDQIETYNHTARPMPDQTLRELLIESANANPDSPALWWGRNHLTYRELISAAGGLAAELVSLGAGPDALVALRLARSPETVVAIVATILAGAAYLPIDPEQPDERIASILDDAAPAVVIATDDHGSGDGRRWHTEHFDLRLTDGPGHAPRSGAPAGHNAAYVIYTSGSTGKPKGVIVEHRAIVNRLYWMDDTYHLTAADRVLQKTPYSFDVSVWEFFWPLMTGASLVLASPGVERDSPRLAAEIAERAITVCHFVPSAFGAFLAEPAAASTPSLRLVICSGEALPVATLERARSRLGSGKVHNLYGPTEAAVDITSWSPGPEWDHTSVPIGFPVHNSAVYVLDDALRPLPADGVGELYLAGVQLARGYLRRPGLTATRFVANPFRPGERMYATGDLARRRRDGAIEYVGRTDDQVKVRGKRIELGEIASALRASPGVSQGVVVVRGSGEGAVIVGYAVPESGRTLDTHDLREHLARHLPGHMVPDALVLLDAIPTTSNGKLDRRRLPEPQFGGGEISSPGTPLEMTLVSVFAEVTGTDTVSATDSFFDLGGNSLLAARLAARAGEALNQTITVADIFAAPSVTALARRLSGDAGTDPFGVLLPLREPGAGVPLFCVHPAGGLGWCYTGLLTDLDPACGVYALQAPSLSGGDLGASLHDLAERYLDEVKSIAPQGPIRLLGWSVGGVIAHEMAALAQARGTRVEHLVLLDAYPGELWRDQPPPSADDIRQAFLIMAGVPEAPLASDDEMVAALRGAHTAFGNLTDDRIRAISSTVAHLATLMREHHTAVVDGDATLWRAAEGAQDFLDPAAWAPHLSGDLTQIDVATTHPGMVAPATLAAIADSLNSVSVSADRLRQLVRGEDSSVEPGRVAQLVRAHGTPILTDDPDDPGRQRALFVWSPDGTAVDGAYVWVNRLTDKQHAAAGLMTRSATTDLWFAEITVPRRVLATYRIYPFTTGDPGVDDGAVRYSREVVRRAQPDPDNAFARNGSPFGSLLRGSLAPDVGIWTGGGREREPAAMGTLDVEGMSLRHRLVVPGSTDVDLLVVFDAEKWLDRLGLPQILDRAHRDGLLPRSFAVLGIDSPPDPAQRLTALGGNRAVIEAIADSLIPNTLSALGSGPRRTVVAGQSLGGLATLTMLAWRPDVVDEALVYSPSVWWQPGLRARPQDVSAPQRWIGDQLRASDATGIPLSLAVGEFESELAPNVTDLARLAGDLGHQVTFTRYAGGHDDAWWATLLLRDLQKPDPDQRRSPTIGHPCCP